MAQFAVSHETEVSEVRFNFFIAALALESRARVEAVEVIESGDERLAMEGELAAVDKVESGESGLKDERCFFLGESSLAARFFELSERVTPLSGAAALEDALLTRAATFLRGVTERFLDDGFAVEGLFDNATARTVLFILRLFVRRDDFLLGEGLREFDALRDEGAGDLSMIFNSIVVDGINEFMSYDRTVIDTVNEKYVQARKMCIMYMEISR